MTCLGFLVSAAAIATDSVPAKEKTAELITAQYPKKWPVAPDPMYSTKAPGLFQY